MLIIFYFYRKLYKALRENTYRIDEDGISVSITTVDGVLARYLTTPFSLIKDIWLAQNYIYIETEDKTDIGVVYLFSDEPETHFGQYRIVYAVGEESQRRQIVTLL